MRALPYGLAKMASKKSRPVEERFKTAVQVIRSLPKEGALSLEVTLVVHVLACVSGPCPSHKSLSYRPFPELQHTEVASEYSFVTRPQLTCTVSTIYCSFRPCQFDLSCLGLSLKFSLIARTAVHTTAHSATFLMAAVHACIVSEKLFSKVADTSVLAVCCFRKVSSKLVLPAA